MRRCSPDSTSGRSPDSPGGRVHLTPRTGSRDPRRHRFDAVVAAFVAGCRARNLSAQTVEFYLEALHAYRGFAGADARDLSLADLHLDLARAWLADFVERGRKPATVAARARALRVFGNWIEAEGYVRTNPIARLRIPRVPRTIVETFSVDQLSDLLTAAPVPMAITLRIFLDTGIRLGEATALRMSDVGDGQLRILGKGGDERTVPFGRTLDAALRRYLTRERPNHLIQPGDPLLLGRDGRPLTDAAIYQGMRRLGERLRMTGVRVSPHTCRHTFAITFLRNRGNVFALQKILGHSDLAMVRRYAELAEGDVTAEHALASPLDHLPARGRRLSGRPQAGRDRRNGASWSSGESR
jgi:integrase/recombinase XerD